MYYLLLSTWVVLWHVCLLKTNYQFPWWRKGLRYYEFHFHHLHQFCSTSCRILLNFSCLSYFYSLSVAEWRSRTIDSIRFDSSFPHNMNLGVPHSCSHRTKWHFPRYVITFCPWYVTSLLFPVLLRFSFILGRLKCWARIAQMHGCSWSQADIYFIDNIIIFITIIIINIVTVTVELIVSTQWQSNSS